jgi:hypothetical protein
LLVAPAAVAFPAVSQLRFLGFLAIVFADGQNLAGAPLGGLVILTAFTKHRIT